MSKKVKKTSLKLIVLLSLIITLGFLIYKLGVLNKLTSYNSLPLGRIVFGSSTYVLGVFDLATKTTKPLDNSIVNKYSGYSQPIISPDGKRFVTKLYKPEVKGDVGDYFIFDLTINTSKELNINYIKDQIGSQYEIRVNTWSSDSKKIILNARDIKNFMDDRCCEGGDYRKSKNLVLEYDPNSMRSKVIHSTNTSPIHSVFYNSDKSLLAYVDSYYAKGHLVNLITNTTEEFIYGESNGFYNDNVGHEYFVQTDTNNQKIFLSSFYEPLKTITTIARNESGNSVYWSPTGQYFIVSSGFGNEKYEEGLQYFRIYKSDGTLFKMVKAPASINFILSPNGKFILTSDKFGVGGQTGEYQNLGVDWNITNTSNGDKPFSSFYSEGTPFLWVD